MRHNHRSYAKSPTYIIPATGFSQLCLLWVCLFLLPLFPSSTLLFFTPSVFSPPQPSPPSPPLPPLLSLACSHPHSLFLFLCTLLFPLIVLCLFLHPPTLLTDIGEGISLDLYFFSISSSLSPSLILSLSPSQSFSSFLSRCLYLYLPPSLLHHHLFTLTHYRSIHHLCRQEEDFLLLLYLFSCFSQLFSSLRMQF